MRDLIVVTADSYQEKVFEALLPRIPSVSGTNQFTFDIIRNMANDSGSYNTSHELLRPYINAYRYALVVFDFEGCGAEFSFNREEIEANVEKMLASNGWNNRGSAIVIKPEIENWMWIDNVNVHKAIGWESKISLYEWGINQGLIARGDAKPLRPKETLEKALKLCGTSKSSSIYKKIAQTVSYRNCKDPSFLKLIHLMQNWFPIVN